MVLAFYALVLEHTLSEEERSQILQTIEMFEVITQTQQDDYQSLEILKVAYQKLGKTEEALRISRRLAEAYHGVGSFSLAMQECEAILAIEPDAPEIVAMLGEIESRLQQAGQTKAQAGGHNALVADYTAATPSADSGLLEVGGRNAGKKRKRAALEDVEQGNDQLAKFLVLQQMFPEDEVNTASRR
jgi:tetratricopeptide (TPR) repeat protein